MTRVAIFDYGVGNIFSLRHSLERAGAQVDVIADFDESNIYSGLLLPGVGHFDPAVRSIGSCDGFTEYVNGMPVLGICLGMEIFFESSQEGSEPGLGVMSGDVAVLPPAMKVPHMGWNSIEMVRPCRLLDGVDDGSWVYFVHSYMARPNPAGCGGCRVRLRHQRSGRGGAGQPVRDAVPSGKVGHRGAADDKQLS